MKAFLIALVILFGVTDFARADWHGHGGGGWGGGHGWGGGGHWHGGGGWGWGGGNPLGNFGASVIGGAIGGWLSRPDPVIVEAPPAPVIVPDIMQPFTGPWYEYCAQKFKTFDPHTGFYMGVDGQRHFCQ